MRHILLLLLSLFCFTISNSQTITSPLTADSLVMRDSIYSKRVNISVSKVSVSELLHTIATVSSTNLNIIGLENQMVSCNFNDVRIADIILFLVNEFNLKIEVVGNIISLSEEPVPEPIKPFPIVEYNSLDSTVSYNIRAVSLIDAITEFADKTGVNVVCSKPLNNTVIDSYVKNLTPDKALLALATANDLTLDSDGVMWHLTKETEQKRGVSYTNNSIKGIAIDSLGMISIDVNNKRISDVIDDLARKLKVNYVFLTPINNTTSLRAKSLSTKELLNLLLIGSDIGYYVDNGTYIFGRDSGKESAVNEVLVFRMRSRSAELVEELIPQDLKREVTIKLYKEQNAIILSGNVKALHRVERFLTELDKSVPMVSLEIIIVDAQSNKTSEIGITMGTGENPSTTNVSLNPGGFNLQWGATDINNLINSFGSFGSVNIGKVTSNFYANLKLLESVGTIELRSMPRLATLNGHEASLMSGETQYYKESQNNIIGTQNPIQSESYLWKSVEANLDIKIVPYVSLDNQITLDISIEQSEFLGRVESDAPPGIATRKFDAIVRVGSEDMILLGGIERNSHEKSTSGLPFLARIPVIKWFFGETINSRSTQKLSVFIKPTVTYNIDGKNVVVAANSDGAKNIVELSEKYKPSTPYTKKELRKLKRELRVK